jgi:hypothetical protein
VESMATSSAVSAASSSCQIAMRDVLLGSRMISGEG